MTKQSPLTDAQIQAIRELLARRPAKPSANTLAEFWQLGAGYILRLIGEIEMLRAAGTNGMNAPASLAIKAEAPCPFCGGQAELHKQLRGGHEQDKVEAYAYFYICDSCECAGGWGKSEGTALGMWNMRAYTLARSTTASSASAGKFCRGEGCPRADLCRRYMDAAKVESPTYFEKSPFQADGQCGEFASNGWLRSHALHCGGAHPPPACAWQCAVELHRWEKRGDEWIWIAGAEH